MITISLDEQGDFEFFEKDSKDPLMIGGVVYNDKDFEDEKETEQQRIKAYYTAVCREYSTPDIPLSYPQSLHSSDRVGNNQVAATKKGVSETIKEFLESGTFKGKQLVNSQGEELPKRRGIYYVYVFVKSDADKPQYTKKDNEFVNERTSSNLYYHMAKDTLNRLMIQSEWNKADCNYALYIATRSTRTFPMGDARKDKYTKAGYEIITSDKDGKPLTTEDASGKKVNAFRVQLTNRDVYRTVIREIISQNELYDNSIDLNVKSITYHQNDSTNEFLYMADSICAILSYNLKCDTANERFEKIVDRAKLLINTSRFLAYGYDVVDDIYEKALEGVKNLDLFEVFYCMYDAYNKSGSFADYYRKNWFMKLERGLKKKVTESVLSKAVTAMETTLKSNEYEVNSSKFIIDHLIDLADSVADQKNKYGQILFRLYSVALSAYSHIGDPLRAKEAYGKAIRYSFFASTEEIVRLLLKYTVVLCDLFELDNALISAKKVLELQDGIAKLKKEVIAVLPDEAYPERSKALSQVGQIYAFKRNAEAEKYFKEALGLMKQQTANYYITESYLLQYYLDNDLKAEYDKKAVEYFGQNSDLEAQFDYLCEISRHKDKIINVSFGLYIYLKALWSFYRDDIGDSLFNKLCDITQYVKEGRGGIKFSSHPHEMILKYLILIMQYKKCTDKKYTKYVKEYDRMLEKVGILVKIIGVNGKAEIKDQRNEDASEEIVNVCTMLKENFFPNEEMPDDINGMKEFINKYLAYMYN